MGADYAEGLMPLAQWWVLLLLVIATIALGYLGILPAREISRLLTDAGFTDLQIVRKGGYTINFRIRKS